MRMLIQNAFVVSVDPAIGDIDGADILVEEGRILAVQPGIKASDAEVIDATGCIAMPGFVDTHRHFWEGALRGVTADFSLLDFIGNVRMFAARFFRPEDMYASSFQGGLEALNAGVTTVADYCHNVRSPEHAAESIRGVRDSGIRAIWSYSFSALAEDAPTFATPRDRLAFLDRLAAAEFSSPDARVRLGVCPEEMGSWGPDRAEVKAQFELARRVGARLFLHANSNLGFDGAPLREVEKLHGLGVLGPDLVLVHMGFTTPEEWALLGEAGGHVSYTPETELQMGLGWPNITPARDAGVNIGFGVDLVANNSADMFFQLRAALQVERGRHNERPGRAFAPRTAFDCAQALYWGTMGGARVCGLEHRIGSLTPGKAADIVLLRADDISMVGWDRRNPAAAIIQQAGVHQVDTVLVDGRIVKRAGRLTGDERGACRLLQRTSDHLHAAALAEGGFGAPEEVLHARLQIPS